MKKITKLAVRMVNGDSWMREFDGEHTIDEWAEREQTIYWPDATGCTLLKVPAISSMHLTIEEVEDE